MSLPSRFLCSLDKLSVLESLNRSVPFSGYPASWKLFFYPCEKYKRKRRKAMQESAFLFPLTGSNTKRDLDLDLRMHYLHQCPPDWPTGESEN